MEQLPSTQDRNPAESVGASTAAILKQTLTIVRRRKWLLVAGLCLTYLLGAIYYYSRDFVYEARASILVHPLGDALSGRNDDRPNFMPTHIRLVASKAVLERSIDKLKLNDPNREGWPSADELTDALKVTSQKDTEILEILGFKETESIREFLGIVIADSKTDSRARIGEHCACDFRIPL